MHSERDICQFLYFPNTGPDYVIKLYKWGGVLVTTCLNCSHCVVNADESCAAFGLNVDQAAPTLWLKHLLHSERIPSEPVA